MKDVLFTTPTRASKYTRAYTLLSDPVIPLSGDKALSHIIEARLFKTQYNAIRSAAKDSKSQIFSEYRTVLEAKKRSYPAEPELHFIENLYIFMPLRKLSSC